MAFASVRQDQIGQIGSGETIGSGHTVSTYTNFLDGLKGGLFARYDVATGGVLAVDGTATPVIAGVTKRPLTGAIGDAGAYTAANNTFADVVESGIVTVEVVQTAVINKFDTVYVDNSATVANQGMATNVVTGNIAVDGYFYKQISPNIWAIRLK